METQNLAGKTIVLTGGTLGIGLAAAKNLKAAGANVAITGRSESSAALAKEIGCEFHRVDYARLNDVRALAKTLLQKYPRIDILANNVGGIMNKRTLTEDGHELTFQVNHLGGFLLTLLLQERLEASGAVIINTASGAHMTGKVKLDDLENEHFYIAMRAYGTAKLMNILHANELNRRFKNVKAVSFHPGAVATGFGRAGNVFIKFLYETPLKDLFMISPEKGADTLEWLAKGQPGKDWQPGEYYFKRKIGRKNRQAKDTELAGKLWDASLACLK
jgi:NAD(P)-dependent dehydrogenase (short-subunit alcohol dehydrogenase family)